MKKIMLLTFLVLFSCTKNQEVKNIEDLKLSSIKIEKETFNDENLILGKEKISNDILSNFYKKSLEEQSIFNCENIHPVYDGMSQKEIYIRNDFIISCNNLKQEAQKELDKKISEFKVTDCEKTITLKFGQISDEYKKELIQTCEYNIAINKGCETLKDETKVKKCEGIKELKEKNDNLKMIEDFDLKSYL